MLDGEDVVVRVGVGARATFVDGVDGEVLFAMVKHDSRMDALASGVVSSFGSSRLAE